MAPGTSCWQRSAPWNIDTFNVGYFGEGGAKVSGLSIQCGNNEPGQLCALDATPHAALVGFPPSNITANGAWRPTPGFDGENDCCALHNGTFRLRNLPTIQESSLQRFFYAPPASECNGSVTFQHCSNGVSGQSTHYDFIAVEPF